MLGQKAVGCLHIALMTWLENVHIRHQMYVLVQKGQTYGLLHIGPIAVIDHQRQIREGFGHFGQPGRVVVARVWRGGTTHQKDGHFQVSRQLVNGPVNRIIGVTCRHTKTRLDINARQTQLLDGAFRLGQGLLLALQGRIYTGNAQQFFVSMHDLVNGVVGQMLRWRVAAYDDRFAQPSLAHFFKKAFLTQRLFKVGIAATSAYAAVQPTRGSMFWRARFGSEEFVQKGRSAA
ncbi:protein of unknown function [Alcaligenes faecalis subsp. faecalis]|nr:protein of unknown function [Alcaligenes faecalis subsp. faecalis]